MYLTEKLNHWNKRYRAIQEKVFLGKKGYNIKAVVLIDL